MNREEYRTLEDIKERWQLPLRERTGAPLLLGGIGVYFDFEWRQVIGHNRTAFRRGKSLAQEVKDGCPAGKKPCLLLTVRNDVDEGPLLTEDEHYIVVTQIRRYQKYKPTKRAVGYFADDSGLNAVIAARRALNRVTDDRGLDEVLATSITTERLVRWAADNVGRIAVLENALTRLKEALPMGDDEPSGFPGVRGETILFPAIRRIMMAAEAGVIEKLAHELTSTPQGREAASGAMSKRLSVRIQDLRDTAREFRELLSRPGVTEPELQEYIEEKPLLLGFRYAQVLPAHKIPRGKVDFMVRRHDGYHDLLELKRPDCKIVRFLGGDPTHPSSYSLSSELAQALAQAHLYREWLAITPDSTMKAQYAIERVRNPRVTIVIGLRSSLPTPEAGMILDQLNLTLHRMEVMPYDMLARRAEIESANLTVFA